MPVQSEILEAARAAMVAQRRPLPATMMAAEGGADSLGAQERPGSQARSGPTFHRPGLPPTQQLTMVL